MRYNARRPLNPLARLSVPDRSLAATRKPGRPPRLGPTEQAVIVALVEAGVTRTAAARYVGVAPQTVWNTARRDPGFARRLERAAAALRLAHLRVIGDAVGRSWRASAWALARVQPERFADPERRSARRARRRRLHHARRQLEAEVALVAEREAGSLAAGERSRLVDGLRDAVHRALNDLDESGLPSSGRAA